MLLCLFLQSKSKTMARQLGPIYIKGTLDDLTFYQMDGEHYVRMKSRLSKKKVLTCPRFALTRMHANQLAEASRIASVIYKQIPKEERNIKLFRSIVGKAKVLLWTGKKREEVQRELENCFIHEGLEYRTRNKEQMNLEVNSERSKVSFVKCETSDVRKRQYFKQISKPVKKNKCKPTVFNRVAAPYGALTKTSLYYHERLAPYSAKEVINIRHTQKKIPV